MNPHEPHYPPDEHAPPRVEQSRADSALTDYLLRFLDALIPPSIHEQSDRLRRARLVVLSSLAFSATCLFFGVQMYAAASPYPLLNIFVSLSGGVFGGLNVLLLRYARSIALPGLALCLEISAMAAFQAYFDLGLRDPVLLWFLIVPWLAAILVRPSFGFVFGALAVFAISMFGMLDAQGHVFPAYTQPTDAWWVFILQMSAVALSIGILGWMYEGQTLKNLRDSNERLRKAHDALQASNYRIENILESINDGFFALDEQRRFTYVNRKAEQLLNAPRGTLLGRDARGGFSDAISRETVVRVEVAARENETIEFEAFYPPLGRWFGVHVYPFSGGLSVYFRDVTAQKQHEDGLVEAKERAEELARMKSTFLANMSHEIRTPLTGILGFASVLSEETSDEHQEFSSMIERSARRLLDTLNSVLDYAQIESGSVQPDFEPVNVEQEVDDVVQLLKPLAGERELYLRAHVHEGRGAPVAIADRTFLNRVLNNLVGNAIKFTDEGGVTVSVVPEEADVRVTVRDTGIGIPDSFLPHLFEEFRQASTGISRSHNGSGLGLAITKHLIQTMDGHIEVESEEGEGTVFVVVLPRAVEENA